MNKSTDIRLPAEWEPQSAVMLTWPHKNSDWQDRLEAIEQVYMQICKTIASYQHCIIVCLDETHQKHIKSCLNSIDTNVQNCIFYICKSNDTWCRDYAALTTLNSEQLTLNNFIFNGWGNKYDASFDNAMTQSLYDIGMFETNNVNNHDFVLEGGSIETDGQGALLTTAACLMKRHTDKTREEINNYLNTSFGTNHILWLEHGSLSGDDTDCHIDNLARFSDPTNIIYAACDNPDHPDFAPLESMKAELEKLKKADGTPYKLIAIPVPEPIYDEEKLLPASYVNFLIINDAVLVPVFGQESDAYALKTIQNCFPDREIIGIMATALIQQYGGIHCATMQFPEGTINIL